MRLRLSLCVCVCVCKCWLLYLGSLIQEYIIESVLKAVERRRGAGARFQTPRPGAGGTQQERELVLNGLLSRL